MSDDTDAAAAMRRDLAAAEAEVARLTTRAEKAEAERDAAVIDLGEQAENFREVLDAELTRSETAEAEVARLREVLVAVDAIAWSVPFIESVESDALNKRLFDVRALTKAALTEKPDA